MASFNSPLEAFLYWESNSPDLPFLTQYKAGKKTIYTYGSAGQEIRKIAQALKSYDLEPLSHVALLSKNCAHWVLSDVAIMMAGHVSIPLYPSLNGRSINKILVHSDSKAILIGKLDDANAKITGIPDIHKISVGAYGVSEGDLWEDICNKTEQITGDVVLNKEDLISIIYTSGTTGEPKGVMHTVGNFNITAATFKERYTFPEHPKFFSYLPLAHIAERAGILMHGLVLGANFSFPESIETFASDLESTQPHLFFAVPRIWTKFQDKILEKIPQKKLRFLLRTPLLCTLVKSSLKKKLGLKEVVLTGSGAAPLATSLNLWFKKIGIDILEGYGMTEDCIISHTNEHNNNKVGTVGQKLPGVEIKLTPEGEICIKNNCLMKGYYKAPELTASVFTKDGYFKTGDIGEYDHDGFLRITGRAKDQFKTDKGKYISPAPIELELSKNTDIEQICIVGTGIPQPIALITLSETGTKKSVEVLSKSLISTIQAINPDLEKHEKIEKIVIMKEDWTVDNGLITPSLKVKRNSIEKIHQHLYKSWFKQNDTVIFE